MEDSSNNTTLNITEKYIDIEKLLAKKNGDFLDIQSIDDVPDEKTVWKHKDALAQSGTYDALFKRFNSYLDSIGLIVNEGKIVDASFVIAPRQRNTREENKKIKEWKGKELFNDKSPKMRLEETLLQNK